MGRTLSRKMPSLLREISLEVLCGSSKRMKIASILALVLSTSMIYAQATSDDAMIRKIIQDGNVAWDAGDAEAYSRHFAADGTFTNILGLRYTGYEAFLKRHDEIFKGLFRGTVLQQEIVAVRFLNSDVAIVEIFADVSGFPPGGPPPAVHTDPQGHLHTQLLQVMVKDKGEWKIASYHNVDVKPGPREPPMK
jgi:uncharacterized protein (TIGR02246 family)